MGDRLFATCRIIVVVVRRAPIRRRATSGDDDTLADGDGSHARGVSTAATDGTERRSEATDRIDRGGQRRLGVFESASQRGVLRLELDDAAKRVARDDDNADTA